MSWFGIAKPAGVAVSKILWLKSAHWGIFPCKFVISSRNVTLCGGMAHGTKALCGIEMLNCLPLACWLPRSPLFLKSVPLLFPSSRANIACCFQPIFPCQFCRPAACLFPAHSIIHPSLLLNFALLFPIKMRASKKHCGIFDGREVSLPSVFSIKWQTTHNKRFHHTFEWIELTAFLPSFYPTAIIPFPKIEGGSFVQQ